MEPCESLPVRHVSVEEQLTAACHHQTNGFTLSRPRDFISAWSKEQDSSTDCRSGDNSPTSVTPENRQNTPLRNQSSSLTQDESDRCDSADMSSASTAAMHHPGVRPEDQGSSRGCSGTDSPVMVNLILDGGSSSGLGLVPPEG